MKPLTRFVALCAALVVATSVASQGPDTLWTRTYGGVLSDFGSSVHKTSDGGYMIAGYTYLSHTGDSDFYLVKTDADGNTSWTRTYGGSDVDRCWSAQQTTDAGYILAGHTYLRNFHESTIYVVKTDARGDTVWTRRYAAEENGHGYSVQERAGGGYVVAGCVTESNASNTDNTDMCLMKLNERGDVLWRKTYGGPGEDCCQSVLQTSDGGYILAGYTHSFGAGDSDIYLVKTKGNGDVLWVRTYGRAKRDHGYSVQETADGGYVVAGYSQRPDGGRTDAYVVRTDENGDALWSEPIPSFGGSCALSIQKTSAGGYVVAGMTFTLSLNIDVLLARIDEEGRTLWTQSYGGSHWDWGFSVQEVSEGGYVAAGYTYSFDDGPADVYLVRTAAETVVEENQFAQRPVSAWTLRPNPSVDRTIVDYRLSEGDDVRIRVYDALGRNMRVLRDHAVDAGNHTIIWNTTDDEGRRVPSGCYFLRLEAGQYRATKKLMVVR